MKVFNEDLEKVEIVTTFLNDLTIYQERMWKEYPEPLGHFICKEYFCFENFKFKLSGKNRDRLDVPLRIMRNVFQELIRG